VETIKKWLTIMDLPSGVVMGIYTTVIIGLSIAAFVLKRSIDSTILTAYGMVAGLFAVHKTTTATTSIITQSNSGDSTTPPAVTPQ